MRAVAETASARRGDIVPAPVEDGKRQRFRGAQHLLDFADLNLHGGGEVGQAICESSVRSLFVRVTEAVTPSGTGGVPSVIVTGIGREAPSPASVIPITASGR